MAKPKLNLKELMLKRGEHIALGVSGAFLALLLMWGISTGTEAADHGKISNDLTSQAKGIYAKIATGEQDPDALPEWAVDVKNKPKIDPYKPVPPREFALTGQPFDPTGRPDTKRENPLVLGLGEHQLDLVRAPMKGFDIIYDNNGDAKIAVKVVKLKAGQNKNTLDDARNALLKNFDKNKNRPRSPAPPDRKSTRL